MRSFSQLMLALGFLWIASPGLVAVGWGQEDPLRPNPTAPLQSDPLSPRGERRAALNDKTLINDLEDSEQLQAFKRDTLYPKFIKLLTGAKFTGQFTVDGKPLTELEEESYEIEKVEKQLEGDLWIITARIKYGDRDVTVPVPLEVKWAGSTPVLTMDNMTLPGFGTFSARVVLHRDKYAGTWQHDDVGGHLFGRIELSEAGEQESTQE